MTGRRVWWGAGAVFVGVGAALLVGPGQAAADTGSSDGGASSSQSAGRDSSDSAGKSADQGSSAAARSSRTQESGAPSDPAEPGSSIKRSSKKAPAAGESDAQTSNDKPHRVITLKRQATETDSAAERKSAAETEKTAATSGPEDSASASPVTSAASKTSADSAIADAPAEDSAAAAPAAVSTESVSSVPEATVATTTTTTTTIGATRKPGPVATLVLDAVSALGSSLRPEAVDADPALAASSETTRAASATASSAQPTIATPLLPAGSNGVTGVEVGHSDLDIPVGNTTYTAPADWYFPTQADGAAKANGVIWLQHGFLADKSFYSALATQLAQQTNSIVVAPTISSFPFACAGCSLNGVPLQQGVATMFVGSREALNDSAKAAGYGAGPLPDEFVLAGHSAGGGFATAVGGFYTAGLRPEDTNQLEGIVMFDGVSMNGTLPQAMISLNTWNVPVYQIAAPAQAWNAFGTTTDDLIIARPDQFVGDVLFRGSHVDSMLGSNPIIDFAAQLVTQFSPAGNTAAVYTLAGGWINDFYVDDAGPGNPQYGFYGQAGQQLIMGDAAAIVLPTSQASQLSPIEQSALGVSTVVPVPTPSQTNGVTGVKVGHSDLYIPVGDTSYTAPSDWYLPTQADGSVNANGVIWLQHGFLGFKSWYGALAEQLARETNSVVVASNIPWFPSLRCPGCSLNGVPMQQGVAALFADPYRASLNISANQAGYLGTLPEDFVLTGHSAGGGLATAAGGYYIADLGPGDTNHLLGVVMYDGVSGNGTFEPALDALAGIPVYQIAAPPQAWNAYGGTTEALSDIRSDQFVGAQLDNGSHVDSLIGAIPIIDFISQLVIKRSPPGNTQAVYTFATGWINDMYAGKGPTDPLYGLYGNPNDGTYVPNQPIVMGQTGATTLPAPPPVDVDEYLGTWYEVGSVKLPFAWCLVNTKAIYSLNADGSIRVENSGNYFGPNGPQSSIVGSAVPLNAANTRLNVNFFLPVNLGTGPGNYWILDYDPDYQWAIVSDPSGFSGFILSRNPDMPDAQYQQLVNRARALGVWGPITPTEQFPPAVAAVPATIAA